MLVHGRCFGVGPFQVSLACGKNEKGPGMGKSWLLKGVLPKTGSLVHVGRFNNAETGVLRFEAAM